MIEYSTVQQPKDVSIMLWEVCAKTNTLTMIEVVKKRKKRKVKRLKSETWKSNKSAIDPFVRMSRVNATALCRAGGKKKKFRLLEMQHIKKRINT